MQVKRWGMTLLAVLLVWLPILAGAETDTASDFDRRAQSWTLVVQRDPRYKTHEYRFNFDELAVRGCGPVSVANAMLATFGVSDQEVTDVFLKEALNLIADYHSAKNHGITINNIEAFVELDEEAYPTIYAYKQAMAPNSCFSDQNLNAAELQKALEPMIGTGDGAISFSKLSTNEWITVARLCHWLSGIGKDDAIITLSVICGGTESTGTPFCDDADGHYMTLLVHVGEYMQRGSVYLIDSLPRAIAGEAYKNSIYWRQYYFASSLSHNLSFRRTYGIHRIQQTVIKMELLEKHREGLAGLTGEALIEQEAALLKEIKTYGVGLLMVFVQGEESGESTAP